MVLSSLYFFIWRLSITEDILKQIFNLHYHQFSIKINEIWLRIYPTSVVDRLLGSHPRRNAVHGICAQRIRGREASRLMVADCHGGTRGSTQSHIYLLTHTYTHTRNVIVENNQESSPLSARHDYHQISNLQQ